MHTSETKLLDIFCTYIAREEGVKKRPHESKEQHERIHNKFHELLNDIKAEAWDEGHDAGVQLERLRNSEFPYGTVNANPYREETEPVGGIHSNHCDDRGCLGCECDPACDDYEETE